VAERVGFSFGKIRKSLKRGEIARNKQVLRGLATFY